MNLWLLTGDEFRNAIAATGWTLVEERREGPWRQRLLECARGQEDG
jgi:hypothetical protein